MNKVQEGCIIDFNKEVDLEKGLQYFNQNGFLLLRGVTSNENVSKLREALERVFYGSSLLSASVFDFLAEDDCLEQVLNVNINSVLQKLLGRNLRVYPNLTARKGTYSPWHIDEAFCGDEVVKCNSKTEFIQVSMFLQDNDVLYGGGIEVIPRSHSEEVWHSREFDLSKSLDIFKRIKEHSVRIESIAGDVVIWDGRLLHRSTPKQTDCIIDKYSLMWTVSSLDSNHSEFLSHLLNRGKLKKSIENKLYDARYGELNHIRKSHFSSSFLEKLESLGINLTLTEL